MNLAQATALLAANAARIQRLTADLSPEQARWKPDPDSWSILEVINHLHDEEREDFKVRLDILLHDPERPWPPIDPQGWVIERAYNERDLGPSLDNFSRERARSLAWLGTLGEPDWSASGPAPWGAMRAGDMLAAWVAHDLLHMRQLVELHWAYLTGKVLRHDPRYAGEW